MAIPPRLYWGGQVQFSRGAGGVFEPDFAGVVAGPVGEVWALSGIIPLDGGSVPLGDGHGLAAGDGSSAVATGRPIIAVGGDA